MFFTKNWWSFAKVCEVVHYAHMQKWVLRFFLLIVFLIPLQKRFTKPLRAFADGLVDPSWNLPGIFEKNLGFYITDFFLLFIAGALIYLGRIRWREVLFQESNKYLTALAGITAVSIMGSAHPFYGLHYLRLVHFFFPLLLCCFVASRLIYEENLVKKVFQAALCVAIFECAVGIVQYFSQDSLGLKIVGEQSLTSRHAPPVSFPMADGSLWIVDHWFGILRKGDHVIRAYGTLPHPNVFGGFLVFSILGTCLLFQMGKRKFWLGLASLAQVFALFITYSRAALYACVASLALFFFFSYMRKEKIWPLVSALAASFALCLVLFYPQLFERGGVVSYTATAQSADSGRIVYQNVAMLMIKDHPVLGVGFDNYLIAVSDYAAKSEFLIVPFFVHNIYLFLCAETGILGLTAFLWFIWRVLRSGWAARGDPQATACLAIFAGFLFIGFCDFYLLWHQCGRLMLFLMAGFVLQRRAAGYSLSQSMPLPLKNSMASPSPQPPL
jgi:hypothetical protein